MKRILVPTDFSKNAQNALSYAVELAKTFDCSLMILHTYSAPRRSDMLVSMDTIMRKDAEDGMQAISQLIPPDVHYDTKIIKGSTVKTIAEYADHHHMDLIIMGTQGASGLEEVFVGSVTGGVMRQAQTPILAIPEGYQFKPLDKIVFALDGLQLDDPAVIKVLKALAEKFESQVVLFHHHDDEKLEKEIKFEAEEWLSGIPLTIKFDNETAKVNESIRKFVDSTSGDLLCMIRRKKNNIGFFERLFKESVTSTHIFSCNVPLLILEAP